MLLQVSTRVPSHGRRLFATGSHHHLIRSPSRAVVQTLLKNPGDACAYGEPVAMLEVENNGPQPLALTSPVSGQVVAVKVKVGEAVRPDTDLALLEGRRPLIQFRYGKGRLMSSAAPGVAPPAAAAPQTPSPSSRPAAESSPAQTSSGGGLVRKKSFMDVPANYGRLPPLSPKEMALLISGGAYDSEEMVKPKPKKD